MNTEVPELFWVRINKMEKPKKLFCCSCGGWLNPSQFIEHSSIDIGTSLGKQTRKHDCRNHRIKPSQQTPIEESNNIKLSKLIW